MSYSNYIWDPIALKWVNLGRGSASNMLYGTTNYWDAQPNLIAERDTFYIYEDYLAIEDEHDVTHYAPGLKIGDGTSYLRDLPIAAASYEEIEQQLIEAKDEINALHADTDENINRLDVIAKYVRYAELEIYYDCDFEYTPNGMCADDDYFYVAVISRNTMPENFEKTRIIKFSRTTYEIIAVAEGDYGHANTLCIDKDNHLLYSAQLTKYYVDGEGATQSETLTGIDVFDVSGTGITYLRTIQTDRRSAGVAFTGGQLYMYYQNGEIYKVDAQTGELELYCTMPVVTKANTQSIEMDDQYIYWLSYNMSATQEEGNIAVYSHKGEYYGQIALDSVIPNVGYLGEYEDLYIEGGSVYLCVANVDRTEAAPYNNMRQAVVFRAYISDVMPNRSMSEHSPRRRYNPQSWGSVTVHVDANTQQYHPQIGSSAHPFKSIRAAIRYLMFEPDMTYFLAIKPGRYSETLKFESIGGKRFRFAKNGTGDVVLDKQITIYDGQIEFRNITFNVTNVSDGMIRIMNSLRLSPVSLSVYACKFDSDTMITDSDTVYGLYSDYPFAADVSILQDSYTANAQNLKHYLPYCQIKSWNRPNDRFIKDISNLNGGYLAHSRIDATNLDLDDFFNPGVYMITGGNSSSHIPSGSNGWLIVLSQPLYGTWYHTLTKQIWMRMGTAGVTDNVIMFRTYGGGAWGQWYRVALDSGAMPSGTTLTVGTGIFTGYITGSKKNFQVTIPLNVSIPANLTDVVASNWSFTMRNNGVSIASININDTEKVASYTVTILPAVGVRISLQFTDAFVAANMGSMVNNDPTIMNVQGNSASLTFTDPSAQPDTPDSPDDSDEVTPDPDDGSTPLPDGHGN